MSSIVIIHGMWCHPHVAEPLSQLLESEGHTVFAADLRNGGGKAESGEPRSISDYVDNVFRQITEQGFSEPPILIGHSMGGLIAQMLATKMETAGVVLLNSAAPSGINHIFWSSFRSSTNITLMPAFWRKMNFPPFKRACYALFNELDDAKAQEIYQSLHPESGRCFFEIVFWWLDREGKTRIEEPIEAPMLIVSGGRDRIVHPRVARALSRRYPDADWRYFENTGHWIFHEKESAAIFGEVVGWLRGLENVGSRDVKPDFVISTNVPNNPAPSRVASKEETTLAR